MYKRVQEGFTLIELLVAIAILAIIMSLAIPWGMGRLKQAKMDKARLELTRIDGSIAEYQMSIGKYPTRLTDLVRPPMDEKDKKKWREGGYLGKDQEVPEDPWGEQYQYKLLNPNKYDLYSFGPNGRGAPANEWIRPGK